MGQCWSHRRPDSSGCRETGLKIRKAAKSVLTKSLCFPCCHFCLLSQMQAGMHRLPGPSPEEGHPGGQGVRRRHATVPWGPFCCLLRPRLPSPGRGGGDPLENSLLVPGLGHPAHTAQPFLLSPAAMPGQQQAGAQGVYQQPYYGHPYLSHAPHLGVGAGTQHLYLRGDAGALGVGGSQESQGFLGFLVCRGCQARGHCRG